MYWRGGYLCEVTDESPIGGVSQAVGGAEPQSEDGDRSGVGGAEKASDMDTDF
jgi:hypothetical protein